MMVDVGALEEFDEARPKIVHVEGRAIGITRWRGEFFATRNRCPHMLAPICEGRISPALISDLAGTATIDMNRPVIGCPWHGWQFDLRSGQALWHGNLRVQTFKTECRDGRLSIELPDRSTNGARA